MSEQKWYQYRQNNSGGSFHATDFVDIQVVVEARSWREADIRAQAATRGEIYFDGCEDGRDCRCCGDRWNSAQWEDPEAEPAVYGRPISRVIGDPVDVGIFGQDSTIHLYHADGAHERITLKDGLVARVTTDTP